MSETATYWILAKYGSYRSYAVVNDLARTLARMSILSLKEYSKKFNGMF